MTRPEGKKRKEVRDLVRGSEGETNGRGVLCSRALAIGRFTCEKESFLKGSEV